LCSCDDEDDNDKDDDGVLSSDESTRGLCGPSFSHDSVDTVEFTAASDNSSSQILREIRKMEIVVHKIHMAPSAR
jgi:hypothetical protein